MRFSFANKHTKQRWEALSALPSRIIHGKLRDSSPAKKQNTSHSTGSIYGQHFSILPHCENKLLEFLDYLKVPLSKHQIYNEREKDCELPFLSALVKRHTIPGNQPTQIGPCKHPRTIIRLKRSQYSTRHSPQHGAYLHSPPSKRMRQSRNCYHYSEIGKTNAQVERIQYRWRKTPVTLPYIKCKNTEKPIFVHIRLKNKQTR